MRSATSIGWNQQMNGGYQPLADIFSARPLRIHLLLIEINSDFQNNQVGIKNADIDFVLKAYAKFAL